MKSNIVIDISLPIRYLAISQVTSYITMEMIEQEIADEYLDNLILNTVKTMQKNRKRLGTSSRHKCLHKNMNNSDVTVEIIESRLSFLT